MTESADEKTMSFKPRNALFGAGAAGTILLGYFLLSTGSITLAPALLVLGYVVLVPLTFLG